MTKIERKKQKTKVLKLFRSVRDYLEDYVDGEANHRDLADAKVAVRSISVILDETDDSGDVDDDEDIDDDLDDEDGDEDGDEDDEDDEDEDDEDEAA